MKLKFFGGKEPVLDYLTKQNKDMYYNINFLEDTTNIIKDSAIDKLLNENINKTTLKYSYSPLIKKVALSAATLGLLALLAFLVHTYVLTSQEQFLSRKGFAFNADRPGMMESAQAVFKSSLQRVDCTFQNLDSSEISLTDVSHYFDSDPTKVSHLLIPLPAAVTNLLLM